MELGGGFGGLGGFGGPMGGGNVVQTYQSMIQNIQKLIAVNPDFLKNGIPNNLLQMCMEQTKFPQMFGVSKLTNFHSKLKLNFADIFTAAATIDSARRRRR